MIKTVIFNGENPENLKKAMNNEVGTVIMPNK
jgi:uridylate kinase